MAHYPTNPTNGQKIGANLCPRPYFNDSNRGAWSAGTVAGSSPFWLTTFTTTKILLGPPNVPVVVGDTFKISHLLRE